MTKIFKFSFSLYCILFSFFGFSQNIIKGKLIDKATGIIIVDANIVIAGTTKGTISKSDGSFELETEKNKLIVAISHLSFDTRKIELVSRKKINQIELKRATYQLDQINLRLGEYDGPKQLINFDADQFEAKQEERMKSYTNGDIVVVEDQASFFGGMDNLKAFVATHFKYPKSVLADNLEGRAYAIFEIDSNGNTKASEIKIVGGDIQDEVKNEFQKLFESMPRWYPGYQRGKPVPIRFVAPIKYAANGYGSKN